MIMPVGFFFTYVVDVSKILNTSYGCQFLNEFITTTFLLLYHTGKIFTWKIFFFHRKDNFHIGSLEFPTGTKELSIRIYI